MAETAANEPDLLLTDALGILLSTSQSYATTGDEDPALSDLLLALRSWAQQSSHSSVPPLFREKLEPHLTFVTDDRSFTRLRAASHVAPTRAQLHHQPTMEVIAHH